MRGRLALALVAVALVGRAAGRAAAGENLDAGLAPDAIPDDARPARALGEPAPGPPAGSSEDHDLDLIPSELREAPPPGPTPALAPVAPARSRLEMKLFLEDAFTLLSPVRATPVPYPGTVPSWQNRTSFDLYVLWEPWRSCTLTLSNRLNLIEQDGVDFLSRQTARNDLREAYVTWEPLPATYLEVGRINLRNGAALGWNPTDFFKTRTLVGQASLDPSAMRQNRLGTLMARAQKIWNGGSVSLAYAPKVQPPSPIARRDRWGVDPAFDATNASHRAAVALGLDLGDASVQILGYLDDQRSKVGLNLTRPLGDAVIAYVEWAGGLERNLIARGFAYGQTTGDLPPDAVMLPPADAGTAFRNDVAAGASWTIARKLTLSFEYHFHQAGFARQDWRNWFDIGSAPASPPAVASELWYLRGYALDQQEPATRHQLFVRGDWPRALGSRLALGGFALVDLLDGSTLAQVLVSFYPSDAWTVALYGSLLAGAARSERGSLPQWGSAVLQVVRYL